MQSRGKRCKGDTQLHEPWCTVGSVQWPCPGVVPQGSVLAPGLFNISTNDLDDRHKHNAWMALALKTLAGRAGNQ